MVVSLYKSLVFVQIGVILFVQIFFYVRIIVIGKPFKVKWNYRISLINEFLICSAFIASFFIYLSQRLKSRNANLKVNIGWVIIIANVLLIFVLLINFFKFTYDMLVLAKSTLRISVGKNSNSPLRKPPNIKKRSTGILKKAGSKLSSLINDSLNNFKKENH